MEKLHTALNMCSEMEIHAIQKRTKLSLKRFYTVHVWGLRLMEKKRCY